MIALPLLVAAVPIALAQEPAAPVVDLVLVRLAAPSELVRLLRSATDVDDHVPITPDGRVRVYADDAEQARLRGLGFELAVLTEDLSAFYAERAANAFAGGAVGSMGGFRTLAEIGQEMDRLANDFPGLVSLKWSLGSSHEGRPIWAMRLSDNPNVDEPAEPVMWLDGLHHAREPMSGESVLQFADWLCVNQASDPDARRALNTRSILIVPCANPDGYEYNRQTNPNGGGMWRKNRRNNGGGSFGVDLNRNYSYEWGPQWPGSSGNPDSETYRGPAPFSEPETQALRDGFEQRVAKMAISAHTYSDLWLYSWGYDTPDPPDIALFQHYGEMATAANGWPHGPASQILYIANGVSIDWHYGVHGALAVTPEIGGNGDGFWPSPDRIGDLFEDVRPGYFQAARFSGGWAALASLAPGEVQGDGDPHVEPGETWDFVPTIENDGRLAAVGDMLLVSPHPEITVLVGDASFAVGPNSQAQTSALRLRVEPGAASGAYALDLGLAWDGETTPEDFVLVVGQPRVLVHDAMEIDDFGWTTNNATNWSWERADPQQTTSGGNVVQPGDDNPAGSGTLCWVTGAAAGSGAGANDVDGTAILLSPRLRASGFGHLELEYARWFANLPGQAQDDVMRVEVSGNGGSNWVALETSANDNQWRTVSFALEDFLPLSDDMRLRITVADEPNNDLTEGLLDDLVLRTVSSLPTLGLWGQTALGENLRFFLDGPPGVSYRLLWSFTSGSGVPVPNVDGLLYLTGGVRTLRTGATGGTGAAEAPARIPSSPVFEGLTVHFQVLFDESGPQAAYSNLYSFTIE